jgi:hypothetical protein
MKERELVTPGSAKEKLLGALPPEKTWKTVTCIILQKKI